MMDTIQFNPHTPTSLQHPRALLHVMARQQASKGLRGDSKLASLTLNEDQLHFLETRELDIAVDLFCTGKDLSLQS
eukprot:758750-Hanusia_phi.AAC.4